MTSRFSKKQTFNSDYGETLPDDFFMIEHESEILEAYKMVQRTGKKGRLLKKASMTPPQPKHASAGKPNYYQNTKTKTEKRVNHRVMTPSKVQNCLKAGLIRGLTAIVEYSTL